MDNDKRTDFLVEEQRINNLLQTNTREKRDIFYQNISSVRTFLMTLVGFSLTILGIVSSVIVEFSEKNIFKNIYLNYIGLILLGLNVIFSIVYIMFIYTIETNAIVKQVKFTESLVEKRKIALKKSFVDKNKTYQDYLAENKTILESSLTEEKNSQIKNPFLIKEKDWIPHIMCFFFIAGIFSLVISIFCK
jgi:magnesium-transporting ATPase (P-type)